MVANKIVIYKTNDGQTAIDVRLDKDTVWLTQAQMAELFQKDRTVIGRHIRNIYKEGELDEKSTCAKFAHMGKAGVQRYETVMYDLDVIISVGYRVKSKRGTEFRIWARRILKDFLVHGFAVNERIRHDQIGELRQLIQMVGRTLQHQPVLTNDENQALFDIVVDYTYALDTLDDYDYQRLVVKGTTPEAKFRAPTTTLCAPSSLFARSLAAAPSSATRKMTRSRAVLARFIRHSAARSCIPVSRRRPPCCFIW